ncbi:histidinol-phosphate transaminase [Namhaeicola litoreus]|uniref:Histidinol-phosphate aminotransferase n=1 Tax=Namhaeicola litoreus TaxID=1052145 RepID=A0ABW3Y557_9FLAO
MSANFNLQKLIRPNVIKMNAYSSARDEFKELGADKVFIDANENPYENGLNRYPDPQQRSVKAKLADIKGVNIENILLGNGSDEILDLIFRAFCNPGRDNVIILPPTYGMYKVLANLNDINVKEVLLDEAFQPNTNLILDSIDDNTKLILICSPNNPTGNNIRVRSIEKILDNFDGIVVIDEAYIDFSNEKSWIEKLEKYPNLIVTQTFSKALGSAAIRLGICYGSKEIIEVLNKIKPPYNINILTQNAAIEKLDNYRLINKEVSEINTSKSLFINYLNKNKKVLKVFPSDANFVLVKVDNANLRYRQLIEKGVVVRNRTHEPLCENCLRFTIGTQQEMTSLMDIFTNLD